jgi:antitoxin component YwqK of YwqJK toxin-antitoxin module
MKSFILPIIFALLIGCGGQEDGFKTHFREGDPLEVKLFGAEPGVKVRVSAGNYKNGKREGHWIFYTKDGKKINWEANFRNGKKHGVVTYWYGWRKSSETIYVDDKPSGPSKHYYENGNLSSASMWYTVV